MEEDSPLILVVDDEPVTRVRVRRALEELGYDHVKEAADGLEAQEILRGNPEFDLVITDILMPGLNGIDLLGWGRENVPGPVWILLSGLDTFDAAVDAIRLGAFDFLAKPPRAEELEVSVRNALEQRHLLKERDHLYSELEDTNRQLLSKVRELEDKSELLRRDLQRAEVIQRALLPTIPPPIERYCIQAVYRPGSYVGGDLYDVTRLDHRHLGIYVADATGHGVTAAMLSVLYKQRLVLVDEQTGRPLAPGAVLEAANRAILEAVTAPGLFLTAAYCLLDTVASEVTLASAGHPPVLHVRADGEVRGITRTGPALGLTEDATFGEERFHLDPNDQLLFYTDGLLQSNGEAAIEKLRKLVSTHPSSIDEILTATMGNGQAKSGPDDSDDDRDDVTVLLLDVHAGPSHFDNGEGGLEEERGRPVAAPRGDVVFYGEGEDAGYLALRGRVIWTHCDSFFHTAAAILEMGRPLVLDLSTCEYLDSTCLGTVHELVSHGKVQVQGVRRRLRKLFEELSMDKVLEKIREPVELPEMHPLAMADLDPMSGPMRILRAHEVLAALSARNREKFHEVVEALRHELSSTSRS